MVANSLEFKDFGGKMLGNPIKSPFVAGKHLESKSFEAVVGRKDTWLGILNLITNFDKMHAPLLSMTEVSKNIIYTDGRSASFIYGVPYNLGCPYLIEVLCEGSKIGYNQEPFHIVLSENLYTYRDIITAHRRHGKQLVILSVKDAGADAEIIPYGDGFRFLVRLASGDYEDYIDAGLLQPQQEYEKVGMIEGGEFENYNSSYTGIFGGGANSRTGLQLYNYIVGTSDLSVDMWMTSDATNNSLKLEKTNIPQLQFLGKEAMADVLSFYTKDQVTGMTADGKRPTVSDITFFIPQFLVLLGKELAAMKEKSLLWGSGYYFRTNGREVVTGGAGYYQQVKQKGNHFYYSDFRQAWEMIMNFSSILYSAKYQVRPEERYLKMKMGRGIYEKLQPMLKQYFETDNKIIFTLDHPALKNVLKLNDKGGLEYTPYRIDTVYFPNFGHISFEVDDSLTFIDADQKYQKYFERYPESAYMIFIEDITSGLYTNAIPDGVKSDKLKQDIGNVVMIKREGVPDSMEYSLGSGYINPNVLKSLGANGDNFPRSSKEKGLNVTLRTHGEVWLQDPSRVLMVEFDPYGEKQIRDTFSSKSIL